MTILIEKSATPRCLWCAHEGVSATVVAHERHFEALVPFVQAYRTCAMCGSLSAAHPAGDLAQHYPSEYYAYGAFQDKILTRRLRGIRASYQTVGRPFAGRLVAMATGVPDDLAALARLRPTRSTRILDVGAGNGRLLRDLQYAGFVSLLGADPFGPSDPGPPRLVRAHTSDLDAEWDIVMYHHCLEHIEDPAAEVRAAVARLALGGRILLRVPLADSDAFQHYGSRWVQLDAPRHRAVPTARGIAELAARTGLQIDETWRDSTAFQFWGSELYARDVALSAGQHRVAEMFTRAQRREWERRAQVANDNGRGDQGVFVLSRA